MKNTEIEVSAYFFMTYPSSNMTNVIWIKNHTCLILKLKTVSIDIQEFFITGPVPKGGILISVCPEKLQYLK